MGHRGNVDKNPLEIMFHGDATAIRAFLFGRSVREVADQIDRTKECTRLYFKRYGVEPVKKCVACGTTHSLTANSYCRQCRKPPEVVDHTPTMAWYAKARLSSLEGIRTGWLQPNVAQSMGEG